MKRLAVGDEVIGSGAGTFAEYAIAAETNLVPKPADLTFEQAASAPMTGLTALQALRDVGKVQPGQKVLINGAGGGIGTFAVQIARSFGAEVTDVCSTSKVDRVRSLGADHVIDYTQEDFTQGDERYDFILVKAPLLSLFVSQRIHSVHLSSEQDDLFALRELLESGKVTTIIGRTYPLSQTPEAIACFGEGHARGKVGVTVERSAGRRGSVGPRQRRPGPRAGT